MQVGLFFDIEETIVGSSDTCILLPEKVNCIKNFIRKHKPDFIETFSWGFWTEGHFVLIDDTVPNKQIIFGDKLIITFINIDTEVKA